MNDAPISVALEGRAYDVHVGAGLLARNAAALGLNSKPWVKTSFAPGSQVVSEYMVKSGLQKEGL